ncbi:TPA: permease [Patescibacteria group bacterium]|uniref:Permease n=2 Tax=Bacteria division Kazan-3B-28 TaxID=1798534 RepID=A0A0G2A3I8_UNCK3|nr:MAG: permease protein, putative ABC transport system permease protein [candidate division Kazan bacterium GW2011_GWA1_50_15]KKW25433.1 MAG: hypothetical protein VE99_C0001G0070 [candidate division Kazan bacterium GW2011_GWC1_52_13]KKW26739.1 MAG: hypothetical protein VF00_C0002G0064 [candidate division Kazan bacterium GW2011_GWB1_52_7]HAV65736.1 permease [Patescibacteria group bacterium]HCL47462.1 permease [Patescibacteria group bacterium]
MKLFDIFLTAAGNLGRNKTRTALTILAIFIGTFTLTLTNGVGAGISDYIDRQLGNVGPKDLLIIQAQQESQSFSSGEAPKRYNPSKQKASTVAGPGVAFNMLTPNDLAILEEDPDLAEVQPYFSVAPDYIEGPNNHKYQLQASLYPRGAKLDLLSGSQPDHSAKDYQVVLPVSFVNSLGFADNDAAVGGRVMIGITKPTGEVVEVYAEVAGVQQKTLISLATGVGLNTAAAQGLFNLQTEGLPENLAKRYAAASAHIDPNISSDDLTALKQRLTNKGYLPQTVSDRIGIVRQVVDGIVVVFNMFGLIALLAAAFGIINTLLMAVQERTKEIGLMKSMGMSGSRIFLLFSTEAALLGFWGSVLGTGAAIGSAMIINRIASNGFLKDFPGLDLLAFPITLIAGIIAAIIAVAFLAGVSPAVRAARKNPIDALRYE